jgi:transcriptional regulator with XRE-family HTH domain
MPEGVGAEIQRFRKERDLSLSELAAEAGVAKSYLSALESDEGNTQRRPSAETLYRLANALGVAVSDLLGRPVEQTDVGDLPPSLREFAATSRIPRTDVDMLASIKFRGDQPETAERWEYIYRAIKLSKPMDESR